MIVSISLNLSNKIYITDKFKFLDKYNLNIGQNFESCTALANHCNKTRKTISKWMDKGWIKTS